MREPFYVSFRDRLGRGYNPSAGSRILYRRYAFYADYRDERRAAWDAAFDRVEKAA